MTTTPTVSNIEKATEIIDDAIRRFMNQKLADVNEVINTLLDARNALADIDNRVDEPELTV